MAQRKSHRNEVHQFVVYYHVRWLIYTANVLEHNFKLKSQKREELRYLKWFCRSTSLNKNHFEMSILLVDDFVFFDCRQLLDSYRCRKSTILCCANAQRKRAPIQSIELTGECSVYANLIWSSIRRHTKYSYYMHRYHHCHGHHRCCCCRRRL